MTTLQEVRCSKETITSKSVFKEFLLNQEFYNPNYVSLLSYQFSLSTKTVVIF